MSLYIKVSIVCNLKCRLWIHLHLILALVLFLKNPNKDTIVLTSTLSSDVKTVVPCVSTTTSPLRIQETWKIQNKMLYLFRKKKIEIINDFEIML